MKKIIIISMLLVSMLTVSATEKADTVTVLEPLIEKVIEHKTTTSKGTPTTRYYFLYNGELVNTSKTVVEKYNLCKKYGARVALAMVIRGKNKRIILN